MLLVLAYDKTIPTDKYGRSFFAPLEQATYDLEISALDYLSTTTTISVLGDTTSTVNLRR